MKLYHKKEVNVLTWQGRIIFLIVISSIFYLFLRNMYLFLSPQSPIQSKTLVVEGWLPDYALTMAFLEFRNGHYEEMFITGSSLPNGGHLTKYTNAAEIAFDELKLMGMDTTKMHCIPSAPVYRERTYTAALTLSEYMRKYYPDIKNFNLYTLGVHGARSWHLFHLAFKKTDMQIGVISVPDKSFDNQKWWNSSKGFRTIPTEALGYLFVYLFYWP